MSELTTVENVKAYLKSPIPSSFDTLIQSLIDAVCDRIELYCGREFTQAQYTESQFGTWDTILILPNTPINAILYAATGWQDSIDITYTGGGLASIDVRGDSIILVENLATTSIPFTPTFTLADAVAAVDALTDWSAVISDTDYANCPAKALTSRTYQLKGPTDTTIKLTAALSPLSLAQTADGLFTMGRSVSSGTLLVVLYDGGYSTFPPALVDTATKMSAELFQATTRESALKSETIGDYSWTASDLTSALIAHSAQLDLFRRIAGTGSC